MTPARYGVLALVLSTWASVWYVRARLRSDVGSRVSWSIWAATELLILVSQYARGGRVSVLVQVPQLISAVIVCVILWRTASRRVTRRDVVLLTGTGLGLVWWAVTRNPTGGVLILDAVSLAALAPTISGAWCEPPSEPAGAWALYSLAGLAAIKAVAPGASWVLFVYPADLAAGGAGVAVSACAGAWRGAGPQARQLARNGLSALSGLAVVVMATAVLGRAAVRAVRSPPEISQALPVFTAAPDPPRSPAAVVHHHRRRRHHRRVPAVVALPPAPPASSPASRTPAPSNSPSPTPEPRPDPTPEPYPTTPPVTPSPTASSSPSPTPYPSSPTPSYRDGRWSGR